MVEWDDGGVWQGLCWPEYCQPIDQVGRSGQRQRRVGLPDTPQQNQVELVEAYCDPRDSRQNRLSSDIDESFYQTHPSPPEPAPSHPPLREYSQPYTTDGSSEEASSSDLSSVGGSPDRSTVSRANDPDPGPESATCAGSCATAPPPLRPKASTEAHAYANVRGGRGCRSASLRQPSPYYYGDLAHYRKAASLGPQHRYTVTTDGLFVDLDRGDSSSEDGLSMPPRRSCTTCRPHIHQPAVFYSPDFDMSARARQIYETAFDCKVARSDDDLDDVDRVSNHPILLQLSGDGRVIGLESFPSSSSSNIDPTSSLQAPTKNRRKAAVRNEGNRRPKNMPNRQQNEASVVSILSEELENIDLNNSESRESNTSQLPLRGYTPSPPSTAPLPTKFQQSKDNVAMNSIKSAPNLPSQPAHPRLKDLRLPVKSLRARETPASSEGSIIEIKSRSNNNAEFECSNRVRNMIQDTQDRMSESKGRPRLHNGLFLEIKGRATSDTDTPEMHRFRGSKESGPILEFKGRPGNRRRHNYSSMESMATSSSGGSMESIRSSTSEGNRSTSSSESRHSTSLSSHSSDSGNNSCFQNLHHANPLSGFISHHANKLHILSPISDKSSQEPASETSDNIKNNNSQKVSPEDTENVNVNNQAATQDNNVNIKIKRRMPQNKNLLNLAFQQATAGDTEIQGSDSGISIHSRDGIKSRNAFLGFLKLNQAPMDNSNSSIAVDANNGQIDFSDLPFDMPKLRRRRAAAQDACTSGSATSVDLRELPFDMPKLRRRLRAPAPTSPGSSGGSHASSSHSVQEADRAQGTARPNLTLNLEDKVSGSQSNPTEGSRGLNLNFGTSTNVPVLADVVDTTLPLERQGWYHGAMTRVEAEGVLRGATEGGFLVRNCESARKDYSLSLKSARGFMHMRIQQSEDTGRYILGQFSRPFDTIPEMIRHFCLNRLPVRGAEHMCLSKPVIAQLL
ncbi:SH2 domain-containing adapter heavyweight [Arctopsyche grandis]|uniref:SH2 domain-containing adapter heavyweight n=1 Tax=Arctopsyche grandis TaxID=121162 RepID=UPI00406D7E3B